MNKKFDDSKRVSLQAWNKARAPILKSIASTLSEKVPKTWVPATSILPQHAKFSKQSWQSLWKGAIEEYGTSRFDIEGHHLFRHKFGSKYFLWCCPAVEQSALLELIGKEATMATPTSAEADAQLVLETQETIQ